MMRGPDTQVGATCRQGSPGRPEARSRLTHWLATALLLCAAGSAWSQAEPGGWAQLTPGEQATLAPLQPRWLELDAAQRQKWRELAARMPSMSADERQRFHTRLGEWAALSPQARSRARLQFEDTRGQLSPAERQAQWEAYRALPAEQRQAMRRSGGPAAAATVAATPSATKAGRSQHNPTMESSPTAQRPVAPTLTQARPGASTTLMSQPASPPPHHQPGMPRVNTTPGFVDRTTMLPRRGAQGAVVATPPAASAPRR